CTPSRVPATRGRISTCPTASRRPEYSAQSVTRRVVAICTWTAGGAGDWTGPGRLPSRTAAAPPATSTDTAAHRTVRCREMMSMAWLCDGRRAQVSVRRTGRYTRQPGVRCCLAWNFRRACAPLPHSRDRTTRAKPGSMQGTNRRGGAGYARPTSQHGSADMSFSVQPTGEGMGIPQLGYGVWQVEPDASAALVAHALRTGYRLIDTAEAYYNEEGVGEGIRASGVARDQVMVATKVWNTPHGYDQTLRAFDASLHRLGLDYVDLYLMHWPSRIRNAYVDTWRAMVRLRDEGRARAIGVCNFAIPQLQ